MFATRRGFLRGLVAIVAATALPITAQRTPSVSAAPAIPSGPTRTSTVRLAQAATWEPLSLAQTATRLFTPASGALLAATSTGLHRSDDAGASWTTLEAQHQSPCGWSTPILAPHPADAARIFRAAGCYAGRNLGDDLEESRDSGATWRSLFTPKTAFPHAIAGGAGLEPGRLPLSVNNDARSGGSILFSSSDDGTAWAQLGEQLRQINGLALGVDGQLLFAATVDGVLRHRLG